MLASIAAWVATVTATASATVAAVFLAAVSGSGVYEESD